MLTIEKEVQATEYDLCLRNCRGTLRFEFFDTTLILACMDKENHFARLATDEEALAYTKRLNGQLSLR